MWLFLYISFHNIQYRYRISRNFHGHYILANLASINNIAKNLLTKNYWDLNLHLQT